MVRINKKRTYLLFCLVILWGCYFAFTPLKSNYLNNSSGQDEGVQSFQVGDYFYSDSSADKVSEETDIDPEKDGLKFDHHVQMFEHMQFTYSTETNPSEEYNISLFIPSESPSLYFYDALLEDSPPVIYQFII